MKNSFEKCTDFDTLREVSLCDYEPYQLVAFVLKAYPNAPKEVLHSMLENLEIGFVLHDTALALLEGYLND